MNHCEAEGIEIHSAVMDIDVDAVWASPIGTGYWIGTVLQGEVQTEQDWIGRSVWRPGASMIFCANQDACSLHRACRAGPLSALFLHLPLQQAERLLGGEGMELLNRGIRDGRRPCPGLISALGWQIQGCTFSGPARDLYLNAKALEIVAHVLADLQAVEDGTTASATLPAAAIRRAHEARDMLLASLDKPPGIPELARRLGTNAHKLGEDFRAVFGSPIYAFVKARRLDEAKRLLEVGGRSIGQVAQALGYHPAHLSTEFKRRFGVTPSSIVARL